MDGLIILINLFLPGKHWLSAAHPKVNKRLRIQERTKDVTYRLIILQTDIIITSETVHLFTSN